jgi:hypothetical protein
MEQVGEAEVSFCLSWAQKNETNLLAKIPDMAFSVNSDRFFNGSVSPQLLFVSHNYYFRTELSVINIDM